MIDARTRAAAVLCAAQRDDGRWEDFELPVGRATAWVTAYVGLALTDYAALTGDRDATRAGRRAAVWLGETQGAEPGWGYNARTGSDADSTAHAILLRRRHGFDSAVAAAWLRQGWLDGGGFSTYRRPDAWGVAHPCVTPVAYLALERHDRRALADAFVRHVLANRDDDGAWRAYWWETRGYSTFVNLLALRHVDAVVPALGDVVTALTSPHIASDFDLACATGAAVLSRAPAAAALVARLLARAQPDGAWAPGAGLRVTEPSCYTPWVRPEGRLYRDLDGLFTTATALRALVLAAELE